MFFYVFQFFQNPKSRDFLRFLPCFVRFLELWCVVLYPNISNTNKVPLRWAHTHRAYCTASREAVHGSHQPITSSRDDEFTAVDESVFADTITRRRLNDELNTARWTRIEILSMIQMYTPEGSSLRYDPGLWRTWRRLWLSITRLQNYW